MPCAIERSRWIEQSRHWRMTERLIHHYATFGGPFRAAKGSLGQITSTGGMRHEIGYGS